MHKPAEIIKEQTEKNATNKNDKVKSTGEWDKNDWAPESDSFLERENVVILYDSFVMRIICHVNRNWT